MQGCDIIWYAICVQDIVAIFDEVLVYEEYVTHVGEYVLSGMNFLQETSRSG